MFQRYTEKARRVIFFARYEASQYGSPKIESEHLLLGLIREDKALFSALLPKLSGQVIREEIEQEIERREPLPTHVEMPLSDESKHILNFAYEEADRLAHKHIGTQHLLLGLLREEKSLAARLLAKHGAVPHELRQQIAAHPNEYMWRGSSPGTTTGASSRFDLGAALDQFLKSWAGGDAKTIAGLFMVHGQLWDANGELWHSGVQIERGLAAHFKSVELAEAPPDVRDIKVASTSAAVVTLVWKPQSQSKKDDRALRMVLVFCEADPQWLIASAHLAWLSSSSSRSKPD